VSGNIQVPYQPIPSQRGASGVAMSFFTERSEALVGDCLKRSVSEVPSYLPAGMMGIISVSQQCLKLMQD